MTTVPARASLHRSGSSGFTGLARAAVALAVMPSMAGGCGRPQPVTVHRLQPTVGHYSTPAVAALGSRVAIVWSAARDTGGAEIFMAISRDGGQSFGDPIRVDDGTTEPRVSGEQPPQVAWLGEEVAAAWPARRDQWSEIRYAVSRNQASSFGASRATHPRDLPGLRGWASLAADAAGGLHLAWLDGRHATTDGSSGPHVHGASDRGAPRQDLYYAHVAADGGTTEASMATDVCFCCKTAVAATAEHADLVWRHIFPGGMRDIAWIGFSAATGPADVVRVSDDNWRIDACPDDGPALGIDASGTRHVVWPTLVDGPAPAKGIFYARSARAGGFTGRERLDDASSTSPAHPRIAIDEAGEVLAVWDERVDGRLRVRLRRRQASGTWMPAETLTNGVADYYPAVAAVPGGFVVAWVSQADPVSAIVVERRPGP